MNFFHKAIQEAKDLDAAIEELKTPKFRKGTPPPPPTSGSNAVKMNPPNVGSSVQRSKQPCTYETPCGWCSKWDKKCDRVIGISKDCMFDLSLYHDILQTVISCDPPIKCIKVTTAFYSYLERRYWQPDIVSTRRNNETPASEFMGIPIVVDDNIFGPYEIVDR